MTALVGCPVEVTLPAKAWEVGFVDSGQMPGDARAFPIASRDLDGGGDLDAFLVGCSWMGRSCAGMGAGGERGCGWTVRLLMTAYRSAEEGRTLPFPAPGLEKYVLCVARGAWKG